MTGNLANVGPTLMWCGVIALTICGGAKLADIYDGWKRRRRTARVLRKYRGYGYGREQD